MKINLFKFKIACTFGAIAILAIFITRPVYSQETAKKESSEKIVLKIIRDDNGKTTVIDTIMEMPDSTMMDSLHKEIDKVIVIGKGGKHALIRMHQMPDGLNYDFEMPSLPECPALEDLDEIEWEGMVPGQNMENCFWQQRCPEQERRVIRSGGDGESLNDVLGDIPMDRVVSYSIKERKGGKRIIIDLKDAPMFERHENVIIIRDPGRASRNRNHSSRQVRVYVNDDQDVKPDKLVESPEKASTPKPATVSPDNKTTKKPKI